MLKENRLQYIIKSVQSENTKALENLLNEMSNAGWDLYSMHEVENDDGFQFNCIFVSENTDENEFQEEDVVNITTFKSQMEKMLSSQHSPYETCKELQAKIKEQRKKINKIKTQLEDQSDTPSEATAGTPAPKNRKHLNEEMSKGLRELDELRQKLIKTISPEAMYSKLKQDKLSIHMSEEILDLVNPDMEANLISETVNVRQKLAENLGYVIPKITFEDDDKLNPYEFRVLIRGLEVYTSLAYPNFLMFFEDDLKLAKKQKDAIYNIDEITGDKIVWIEEKKTKAFWQKGLTAAEFIARLLEHSSIKYIDELLDYSDINKYIELVSEQNMFLIENIFPDFISIAELRYILASLLREEISIKDIVFIFEKINDFSDEASKEDLLDKVRLSLARYISKKVANEDNVVQAFALSEKTYKNLFGQIEADSNIVKIEGSKIGKIATSILKKAKINELDLSNLVIFAPIEVRHMAFLMLSQFIHNIKVVAKEEITNEYTIEIIDEI